MRLIDADRLKAKITGITKPHEFVEEIDRRPTVVAIPVEWLKQWEGYEQGMAIVNLRDIVEYWEKENETNVEC